jgi:hypothetical protein
MTSTRGPDDGPEHDQTPLEPSLHFEAAEKTPETRKPTAVRTILPSPTERNVEQLQRAALQEIAQIVDDLLGDAGGGIRADVIERALQLRLARADTSTSVPGAVVSDVREVIEGDLPRVNLIIAARADQLAQSPSDLEAFIRGTVAKTIASLEARGEADREGLTDAVIAAFGPLRRRVRVGVAESLFRYLSSQSSGRAFEYFVTATMVADLTATSPAAVEERAVPAAFMYHFVLANVLTMLPAPDDDQSAASAMVATCAVNLATLLEQIVQRSGVDRPPGLLQVLRALGTIRVAWTHAAEQGADLSGIANALDLPGEPSTSVPIIAEMGAVSGAWSVGRDPVVTAYVEAASAIANAALGDPNKTPARLFNAGVSLQRVARQPDVVVARLLVNLLGLRWALWLDPRLDAALLEHDGLDCIVNFFGELVDAQRISLSIPSAGRELASDLAGLPRLLQSIPSLEVDLARIRNATRTLGLTAQPAQTPTTERISDLTLQLICELGGIQAVPRDTEDRATWSAVVVRAALSRVVTPQHLSRIADDVASLSAARSNPLATFTDAYREMTVGEPTPYGPGPLVAASVITPDAWNEVSTLLTMPIDTIVPVLQSFSFAPA